MKLSQIWTWVGDFCSGMTQKEQKNARNSWIWCKKGKVRKIGVMNSVSEQAIYSKNWDIWPNAYASFQTHMRLTRRIWWFDLIGCGL